MSSSRSLALQLTVWYSVFALLMLLAATGYLSWALLANLDEEDDQFLLERVARVRAVLDKLRLDSTALKHEVESLTTTSRLLPIFVRVFDDAGNVVAESAGMHLFAVAATEAGEEVETADGRSYRVIATRGNGLVIQAALDRTREEVLIGRYIRNVWGVLAVAVLLCAFGGYRIAQRCIGPLRKIIQKFGEIGATTLDRRIESAGEAAEISALTVTFNAMLDRLEESFTRLSQFSADIAHELRTPVNNMRGEMEVALGKARLADQYRDVLGSSLEECQRLSRIIDSLLFLARAEHPETQIRRERLNVGEELRTVLEFYEAAATESGITLAIDSKPEVKADLDRTLFQRAMSNLVANAISYTGEGGRVNVTVVRDGASLRVEVADTGCGISQAHLPHVFDRLYRVDGARTAASGGVGLGLAIVKSIAELHGGTVEVASEEGRGTRVALVLAG
jgi:two-component system, OmpR family, heavy metal sensor histidine kinase CusS